MADLLAIDPSIDSAGVALFRDSRLVAAARIHPRVVDGMLHAHRALAMADAIVGWTIGVKAKVATVAHEWPHIRPNVRANPNNLIGMAVVDGAVDCALSFIAVQRGEQLELLSFLPEEWCGQLPKNTRKGQYWKSPRGTRIKSRLTDAEFALVVDENHDVGDSVGVGLHALGRLGLRRALASR